MPCVVRPIKPIIKSTSSIISITVNVPVAILIIYSAVLDSLRLKHLVRQYFFHVCSFGTWIVYAYVTTWCIGFEHIGQ